MNELAILVAQDVLQYLPSYTATNYTFLTSDSFIYNKESDLPIASLINESKSKCHVCALGACFLSLVHLKIASIQDVLIKYDSCYFLSVIFLDISNRLEYCFGIKTLCLIEIAYSSSTYCCRRYEPSLTTSEERHAAKSFAPNTEDYKERLRLIMENIIENKGEFLPAN